MVGRLMFVVDTNVWLEVLLEQENAEEAKLFLSSVAARELAITEFSLYSIGIILCKLGRAALFQEFLADGFERCGICRVRLGPGRSAAGGGRAHAARLGPR